MLDVASPGLANEALDGASIVSDEDSFWICLDCLCWGLDGCFVASDAVSSSLASSSEVSAASQRSQEISSVWDSLEAELFWDCCSVSSSCCSLTVTLCCLGKSPHDVDPCPSSASPGPSAFPGSGSGGGGAVVWELD